VDATNVQAVQRLLDYKGGRGNKPVSIAVADIIMAQEYVELNETAESLYSTLLPGPVTVISKNKGKVARQLVSDMNTLGIRIPDYPLLLKLLKAYGKPLTSTSANTSGGKPPYSHEELCRYTSKNKLNYISLFLDAGRLPVRKPSTVVDTTLNEPTILRQGSVTLPRAAKVFGSSSVEETLFLGEQLMHSLNGKLPEYAVIFALQGELGAGKTHLTKGIAKALGVTEVVNSPTYTIVKEYEIDITPQTPSYSKRGFNGTLFHVDTWRLHEGAEMNALGFEAMLKPGNVIVIEWLEKMKPILEDLAKTHLVVWVDIDTVDETKRTFKVYYET
jgi:L-threonylcarbamoyladenylate synthase